MEHEHWAQMEVLEWEHIEQMTFQAQAVEAEDADCWALDTLLALAAVSMPHTVQPLLTALQGFCVPPTTP